MSIMNHSISIQSILRHFIFKSNSNGNPIYIQILAVVSFHLAFTPQFCMKMQFRTSQLALLRSDLLIPHTFVSVLLYVMTRR